MTTKKLKVSTPKKRGLPKTYAEIEEFEKQHPYGRGCIAGRKEAELYLHELALNPELLSMPLLGSYVSKIRDYPANDLVKGKFVGFFARVEREFARVLCEDAWRAAPWATKWKFAKDFADKPSAR
jgi:hypothetical protein